MHSEQSPRKRFATPHEAPVHWSRFESARSHWRRHGGERGSRVVVVGDWTAEQVRTALAMGVRVLIHESAPATIRDVAQGTLEAGGSFLWLPRSRRRTRRSGHRLTAAQLRVLQCVSAGLKSADIAAQLRISVRTVETHRYHILRRTGIAAGTPFLRLALSLFPAQ